MSLFDYFRSQREKQLVEAVESLTTAIQAQQSIIEELTSKVLENRQGIVDLTDLITFVLQQQTEITQHIGLMDDLRKGKMLPSVASLLESDDDLVN